MLRSVLQMVRALPPKALTRPPRVVFEPAPTRVSTPLHGAVDIIPASNSPMTDHRPFLRAAKVSLRRVAAPMTSAFLLGASYAQYEAMCYNNLREQYKDRLDDHPLLIVHPPSPSKVSLKRRPLPPDEAKDDILATTQLDSSAAWGSYGLADALFIRNGSYTPTRSPSRSTSRLARYTSHHDIATDIPQSAAEVIKDFVHRHSLAILSGIALAGVASATQARIASLLDQVPDLIANEQWGELRDTTKTHVVLACLAALAKGAQSMVLTTSVSSYMHSLRERLVETFLGGDTMTSLESYASSSSQRSFGHTLIQGCDHVSAALQSLLERGLGSAVDLVCLGTCAVILLPRWWYGIALAGVASTGYRYYRMHSAEQVCLDTKTKPVTDGHPPHSSMHRLYTFVNERLSLQGASVVIPYRLASQVLSEFTALNDASRDEVVKTHGKSIFRSSALGIASAVTVASVMGLGISAVSNGIATPQEVVTLAGLTVFASRTMKRLNGSIEDYKSLDIATRELSELVRGKRMSRRQTPQARPATQAVLTQRPLNPDGLIPFRVSLDNVSIAYPTSSRPVLTSLSCDLYQGELVVIRGESGSGKSSLLSLLAGLIAPSTGAVHMPTGTRIAFVPQSPSLWDGTIIDNVRLGAPGVSDDEVDTALAQAACSEFVNELPLGMYSPIRGGAHTGLSIGQQQRIALARALVSRPDVLLLDETTSSLDSVTSETVLSHLRGLCSRLHCLILLVTHRESDIYAGDRVLLVERDGSVADLGCQRD